MLFSLIFTIIFSLSNVIVCDNLNTTKKITSDDYYQLNYDYEIFNNNKSIGVEFSSDSLILPIPDENQQDSENFVKNDENFNGDLKDHDFIDNLMYIYYGNGNKNEQYLYASEIIIGGSVLSFVAQFSTILLVLVRKDINGKKDLRELFLHLIGSLCLSNIVFIFGVFQTKYFVECLMIALFLTYLHLINAFWIFLYCYYIYRLFCENEKANKNYLYIYGYGIPLIFSLISFMLSPQSYETRKFCFISVQRGMILNYMIPIFCLMILTAFYCIKGIHIFNLELYKLQMNSNLDAISLYNNQMEVILGRKCGNIEAINLRGSKSCLRRLCAMQTTFDIIWFFSVLALDNMKEGSSLAVVFAFTTCCLNWYIFVEIKIFFPTANKHHLKEVDLVSLKTCNGVDSTDSSPSTSENKPGSSDSVPLLVESTELKVLYHNPIISTITN